MENILTLEHLSYSYHTSTMETPALSDLSFSIETGKFVSIVGPSGCGKSTLLSIIAGLLPPETGTILLNGTRLAGTHPTEIGYMLQRDHLFEWRTIEQNVLLGLQLQGCKTRAACEYASTLLETYGLTPFRQYRPSQLSGGMRQRAALIRTLVLRPSLLLLDEPFSALDYQNRLKVSSDICSIIRNEKKTVLLVTHDLSEAISLSDSIIVLSSRPGSVKYQMTLEFPAHLSSFDKRSHPLFQTYFNSLWKEISNHEATY